MGLQYSVTWLVISLGSLVIAHPSFTLLEIDNHPCKPENLKKTDRYICDSQGRVICQTGWRNPSIQDFDAEMYPCLEPICDKDGQVIQILFIHIKLPGNASYRLLQKLEDFSKLDELAISHK